MAPDTVDEARILGVREGHFHRAQRRSIWAGMVVDRERGVGPDAATVLERHEAEIGPGGPFRDFSALATEVTHIRETEARRAHLARYAEAVSDAHSVRRLLAMAREVQGEFTGGGAAKDLLELAQRGVQDAADGLSAAHDAPLAGTLVERAVARSIAVADGTAKDTRLLTGLRALDRVLEIHPGDYTIIAGRPSMGKTQLTLTLLAALARRHGPVLLCSAEMGSDAIGHRIASSEVRPGALMHEEGPAVVERWQRYPVRIDTKSRSLDQVLSAVRVARQRYGIVAAAVDYLQMLRLPQRRGETREQAVANASRELCGTAKDLGIALLVLSQLNRGLEHRPDKRPIMADLRESGQLEQDADAILFVYRDVVYNPTTPRPHEAEAIIAKQRNGPIGTCYLRFRPGDGWFTDPEIDRNGLTHDPRNLRHWTETD